MHSCIMIFLGKFSDIFNFVSSYASLKLLTYIALYKYIHNEEITVFSVKLLHYDCCMLCYLGIKVNNECSIVDTLSQIYRSIT